MMRASFVPRSVTVLLSVAVLMISLGGAAEGSIIVVDTTADAVDANPGDGVCDDGNGNCSLRAALQEADALPGSDTVTLPSGTYTLTLGSELIINSDVSVVGDGAASTIIQAAASAGTAGFRVLFITSGAVYISGVTIRHGNISGTHNDGGGIDNRGTLTLEDCVVSNNTGMGGGGIYNPGTLFLNRCTVSNNTAVGDIGGGIFVAHFDGLRGTMEVADSTISGNTAGARGGGFITGEDPNTITNTTISGNSAGIEGGGIYNGSHLTIVNSTITGNTAGNGGGLSNEAAGVVDLSNTIIAGNFAPVGPDCNGETESHNPNSLGYNLIGDGSDCFFSPSVGDLVDVDALLGPLVDNGGPTETHAPLPDSPAIDQVVANCDLTTDQRGVSRPQGIACDAGSVELIPLKVDLGIDQTIAQAQAAIVAVSIGDEETNGPWTYIIDWGDGSMVTGEASSLFFPSSEAHDYKKGSYLVEGCATNALGLSGCDSITVDVQAGSVDPRYEPDEDSISVTLLGTVKELASVVSEIHSLTSTVYGPAIPVSLSFNPEKGELELVMSPIISLVILNVFVGIDALTGTDFNQQMLCQTVGCDVSL